MEYLDRYMDFDKWNSEGPKNQHLRDAKDTYDGTTRHEPTHPYYPVVKIGGQKNPDGTKNEMSNPNRQFGSNSFDAGHSLHFHYMNTLNQGGKEALRLVREVGKKANEVVAFAKRQSGNPEAYTVVAPTTEEARIARALIETSNTFYPHTESVVGQQLPTHEDQVDFAAYAKTFDSKAKPPRFRARTLDQYGMQDPDGKYLTPSGQTLSAEKAQARFEENAKKRKITYRSEPRKFAGIVAVYADPGMTNVAENWFEKLASNDATKNLVIMPMGGDISANRQVTKGMRTQMGANGSNRDSRGNRIPFEKQILTNCDAVVIFHDGNILSEGARLLATAAEAGKLSKIIGKDGKELPIFETYREARAHHMTSRQYVQAQTLDAFEIPAGNPHGRMALSKIKDTSLGALTSRDISTLAQLNDNINTFVAMAKGEKGRSELLTEHRITPNAIKMLADDTIMAKARQDYIKELDACREHGISIVGKEDFPQTLLSSGKGPDILYVAGNIDKFRSADNLIGLVGDGATYHHDTIKDGNTEYKTGEIASKALLPVSEALTADKTTKVYVEGATSIKLDPSTDQIRILSSGHSHAPNDTIMQERKDILANGGLVISTDGPVAKSHFYDVKARELKAVPSKGDISTRREADALLAHISNAVVVTDINPHDHTSDAHIAVKNGLEIGRRPIVVNPNGISSVPNFHGNVTLITRRGEDAFTGAGFAPKDVETLKGEYEGSRLGIDLGKDPKRGLENFSRLMRGEDINLHDRQTNRQASAKHQDER